MKKVLQDYLLGVVKEYKFRMKVADILDDALLNKLELYLAKYDLIDMSAPKETILQSRTYGFEDPINSEVTIIEFVLGHNTSAHYLMQELSRVMNKSTARVFVERGDAFEDEEAEVEEEYVTKLSTDPAYPEDEGKDGADHYGDRYNKEMLDTIDKARKEGNEDLQLYKKSKYAKE